MSSSTVGSMTFMSSPIFSQHVPVEPPTPRSDADLLNIPFLRIGNKLHSAREQVAIPPTLRRLKTGEKRPGGCGMFSVMTSDAGDDRLAWDARFPEQINDAKKMFNDLVAKGMVPYRVDPKGKKSPVLMTEFDPWAEEVVFCPVEVPRAVVGG